MQTFLPLHNFTLDAQVLDNKRLHKQALEGYQILMNLVELNPDGEHRTPRGWSSHPAVKMWRGYENALYQYIQQMVKEWKSRGYKSTLDEKSRFIILRAQELGRVDTTLMNFPHWMEDTELFAEIQSSHRTALLNKNYEWYAQFGWAEDNGHQPDGYEYTWPV
jgi:hypothetical protein